MTDSELRLNVKEAQGGNARAFGELYSAAANDAYRFALWYIKDPFEAEDAVQEAAIKAYKNIKSLKKPSSFKSWFMSIVLNCCKDILSERQQSLIAFDCNTLLEETPYYDSYENRDVLRQLKKLSDTDRKIILMSVLGDFKSGEIAKEMGMTATAVRSRLSRALQFLRTEMEKEQ
ncbi:MAG: RNA polymerase sigma factor [Oscillospiraceae bacterium]|nr:RNA polymerase sigma factor [Oscillospiraceae bacterium]